MKIGAGKWYFAKTERAPRPPVARRGREPWPVLESLDVETRSDLAPKFAFVVEQFLPGVAATEDAAAHLHGDQTIDLDLANELP